MLLKRLGRILSFPKAFFSNSTIYPTIRQFQQHENYLSIKWTNGQNGRYLYVWLRENCPETHTMRLTDVSKSRKLSLRQLDLNIKPIAIENHIHSLSIKWPGEISGNYSSRWLCERNHDVSEIKTKRNFLRFLNRKVLWDANHIKKSVDCFEFSQLFTSQQNLHDFLTSLLRYGLVFIKNAPRKVGQLELLTNLIGFNYITPYGPYFSVRGSPSPTNQAYTNTPLPFHMDEPYLQYAPQIQALHCIHPGNGGESNFVDGYFIAEKIRKEQPKIFNLLSSVKVEYADEGKDFVEFFNVHRYPIFTLDKNGVVKKVVVNDGMRTWYLDIPFEEQYDFYKALKYFDDQCNTSEHYFQRYLNAGDIVFFDNMRVLHGRTGFQMSKTEKTEERLLEGVYFNYDVFNSKIRLLRNALCSNGESKHFVSF